MSGEKDYFEVLNIPMNATMDEIKNASKGLYLVSTVMNEIAEINKVVSRSAPLLTPWALRNALKSSRS